MTKPASKRQRFDWEAMESDWRAGIKSKKQLAEEYGVSRAAIDKHWAAAGIERDLSDRIRAAARAKVTRASVTPKVTHRAKVTEQDIVEAESELQSRMHLSHRKDITQKRELVAKLFAELEGITDGADLIEQLTLALAQADQEKLANIALKVASLPGRIKGVSDLVGAYKALIALERQAFNMDDNQAPSSPGLNLAELPKEDRAILREILEGQK